MTRPEVTREEMLKVLSEVTSAADAEGAVDQRDEEVIQTIRNLIENNDKLREALESMVNQFAYVGQDENGPTLLEIGYSAVREAFEALGWQSPKPIPERKCQAEGCKKEATCGTPTKDGYKRLCGSHYNEVNK